MVKHCEMVPECPPGAVAMGGMAEHHREGQSGWGWLGAIILWFIVFTVLFWLIFYSLRPRFVLKNDSNEIDPGKVLLSAVIAAIIVVIVIFLIRILLMSGKKCW